VVELNVRAFDRLFSTGEVRVSHMVLAPGEEVPWHLHQYVRDTFYVLRGPLTILTYDPEGTTTIHAGEMFQTRIRQPHRVVNTSDREVSVLLIQGVGKYDFQPLPLLEPRGDPSPRPLSGHSTSRLQSDDE